MPKASCPIPILRSFDEIKAKEFYVTFLGFSVGFEHRFAPELPLYLSVVMDDCEIHLSEHHGDCTPGSALRISVDDVQAYCATLSAKRYTNARPSVTRTSYGFDEMSILDPFGNRLVFCTRVA